MKLLLTDRFCDRAKARSGEPQTDYFDETVSGLALRVAVSGRKTWTLHYTSPNSAKRSRVTLGTYPATSLGSARVQALEARGEVEDGRDPRLTATLTLQRVCEDYLKREGPKLRSRDWYEATIKRLIFPKVGEQPIAEIKRSDIVRLLDKIEDDNGPVMADRTLSIVRKIMNWHASRSDEFRSPIVRGMARTKPKERARDRTLTDDELRAIWAAASEAGTFGHYIQFVLLTATRRNEAARLRRSEITGTEWVIPGARYKIGKDHVIPLSQAAQGVLAKLPSEGTGFVFTTTGGVKPITAFWKFKENFDKIVPLPRWTIHDLRRTARSLMSRAGVASDHAERCLGHVIGGVRGVYDRHEYLEEKRFAFEALASLVERIVNPSSAAQANVVPLRGQQ
jgi:integrase